MQSTVDIDPAYENSNLNLLACLALYQHRQDIAGGISWVSKRTRSLLLYYKAMQMKDFNKLFSAAYYNGIIQQGQAEIATLTARAENAKNKGKLLERAIEINAIIQAAKAKIDEFETGQE